MKNIEFFKFLQLYSHFFHEEFIYEVKTMHSHLKKYNLPKGKSLALENFV